MLGDGSIQLKKKSEKANARYIITMKASSKEYITTLTQTVFHPFRCSNFTPYPNPNLPQHKDKEIQHYFFCSANLPFFTILHSLWYKWDPSLEKYTKVVPKNISKFFTVESLKHWIIQDGYYDGHGRTKTVLLCTESFTKEECFLLQKVLLNFQLKSSLKIRDKQRETYRIRISKTSIKQLQSILLPIIPVEFHYKLGNGK